MSSALRGSGGASAGVKTKREVAGSACVLAVRGSQREAGRSSGGSGTLRGPTRRSTTGAMISRQSLAARARSAGRMATCMSASAASNVAAVTFGPRPGPVPQAVDVASGVPASAAND